jgi:hypothetical protein
MVLLSVVIAVCFSCWPPYAPCVHLPSSSFSSSCVSPHGSRLSARRKLSSADAVLASDSKARSWLAAPARLPPREAGAAVAEAIKNS